MEDADLGDGDVTVAVTHSTINYKDGLALTGRLPGMRLPLVPGVDFAGYGDRVDACRLRAGRRRDPQRLGLRRAAPRRLCAAGARTAATG